MGVDAQAAAAAKVARVGYLEPVVPQNGSGRGTSSKISGVECASWGTSEGKNLDLVIRWGEGKLERMPASSPPISSS